jgi:hypothetical protein
MSGAKRRLKNVRLGSGRGGSVDVIRLIVAPEAVIVREITGRSFPPAIYGIIRGTLSWSRSSIVTQIPQVSPAIASVEREIAMIKAQITSIASELMSFACSHNVPDLSSVASDVSAVRSNLSRVEPNIAGMCGCSGNSRNLC